MKSGTAPYQASVPGAGRDRQPPYRKWYPCAGWLAESLLKPLALSSTEPQRLGINGAGRNIRSLFEPLPPAGIPSVSAALRCAARWRARLFSGVVGMSMWVMPSGLSASTTAFMIAASAPTLPALAGTLDTQGVGLGRRRVLVHLEGRDFVSAPQAVIHQGARKELARAPVTPSSPVPDRPGCGRRGDSGRPGPTAPGSSA
jgi:hypothetical protein